MCGPVRRTSRTRQEASRIGSYCTPGCGGNPKGRTGTADRANLFGPYRVQRPAATVWRTLASCATSPFPNPSREDDRCLTRHRILRGSSKCRRCHADQKVEPSPSTLAALAFAACSARRGSASKPKQPAKRTRPCDDTPCGDSLPYKTLIRGSYRSCTDAGLLPSSFGIFTSTFV